MNTDNLEFKSAAFTDDQKNTIRVIVDDGSEIFVPVSEDNKDYQRIFQEGLDIVEYVREEPPKPTLADIAAKQKELEQMLKEFRS